MTLFEALFIAHLLGDWLFQTEWMAVNKSSKFSAMAVHLLVYHIFIAAALLWKISDIDSSVFIVLAIMIIVHAILDLRWTVDKLIRLLSINVKREPEKWLKVAIDQTLHFLLLAGVSVYFTGF